MPTIVGILIFISMINKTSENLKARKDFFSAIYFYELLKLHAQLSLNEKSYIALLHFGLINLVYLRHMPL